MVALWRVWLIVPTAAADALVEVLSGFGTAVAYGTPALDGSRIDPGDDRPAEVWRIECLSETEPDISAVTMAVMDVIGHFDFMAPDIHLEQVPPIDWLAQNRSQFPPIRAGRFFIKATFDETPPPPGSMPLRLDAGPAFGSGQHPTTHGCLMMLDFLLRRRRYRQVLDLGCGSGILALAVAAKQRRRLLAIDNDPWSVRTTRDNARLNRLAPWIDVRWGDGLRQIPRVRQFDLVCANILARPLTRMAPAIAAHLAPDGVVVLSGLLDYQEPRVLAAYRAQGLGLVRRITGRSGDGGLWVTLLLAR